MHRVRVRFAPSPTGYLHIGGARTALFNYLFARANQGTFVLRVEDTDVERTVADSVDKILDGFRWLGLTWDEGPDVGGEYGPYFQSQRREVYAKYAMMLLETGRAYRCYCTTEELEARRREAMKTGGTLGYDGRCRSLSAKEISEFEKEGRQPALRLKTPLSGRTVVRDLIHGEVAFDNKTITDFVIMKSDGFPTYNFACVVDDHLMQISHVIRADEHLSNTPKQMMIYDAFGWTPPAFAHVPMILAPDRSKLSKRHGAQSVEELKQAGFLPEAVLNYIALLGWTPSRQENEFLSLQDMIDDFDLSRVSSTPAVYDLNKLAWMNGWYIRHMDIERLTSAYVDFARDHANVGDRVLRADREWLKKVVSSLRERSRTLLEMVESSIYFFEDPRTFDGGGVKKYFGPEAPAILRKCAESVKTLDRFDASGVERVYRGLADAEGVKAAALIHPTRLALTGRTAGPGLFEIMELLGKDTVVRRLEHAANAIETGSVFDGGTEGKAP